ncbi:type IV secretion system protein [Marinicella sp. W31]|uniref:type IV secretion system protein n=1 Tax=Marinicella sp. W31 TaxID=3023713 RepID=UPI0037564705
MSNILKTSLLVLLLVPGIVRSNAVEVAQNVFQEFRQVQELIKQAQQIIRQIEEQVEMIKNISGKNIYQMTVEELELLRWLPDGDALLEPALDDISEYARNLRAIREQLDLEDPYVIYGLEPGSSNPLYEPKAASELEHQNVVTASSAFAKTLKNQIQPRMDVTTGYLNQLNSADSMKQSVDLNARLTGQAVLNQIEINRSMSMLIRLESAKVQRQLSDHRYFQKFINNEE